MKKTAGLEAWLEEEKRELEEALNADPVSSLAFGNFVGLEDEGQGVLPALKLTLGNFDQVVVGANFEDAKEEEILTGCCCGGGRTHWSR